jgi:hypothetical protein
MKSGVSTWTNFLGESGCVWVRLYVCTMLHHAIPLQYPSGIGFYGGEVAGTWSWLLATSSSEVKNAWNCSSTPPYIFIKQYASVIVHPLCRQMSQLRSVSALPNVPCTDLYSVGSGFTSGPGNGCLHELNDWHLTTSSFRILKYLADILHLRNYIPKAWIEVWMNMDVLWDITPCRLVTSPMKVTHIGCPEFIRLGFPLRLEAAKSFEAWITCY